MYSLPGVDFSQIAALASAALQSYGTPALFRERGAAATRTVRALVYRNDVAAPLVGEIDQEPANILLDPADFAGPRKPQKFDELTVAVGGWSRTYMIDEVHPMIVGDALPLIRCAGRAVA